MKWDLPYRRVAVLGLGRTGRAVTAVVSSLGVHVFVSERKPLSPRQLRLLSAWGAAWEEGGHSERILQSDLIVVSPGVPLSTPALLRASAKGIPVWSELELSWRLASSGRVIAITGTNGKSTTTALVGRLLAAGGACPVVAGNIGRPAIRTVAEVSGRPWVLETSSYQLEGCSTFRPDVAVWLNFALDHLDHHGSAAAYFAAKARLVRRQGPRDLAVLPPELIASVGARARVVDTTCVALPDAWSAVGTRHQRADLQAAWAAAVEVCPRLARCPPDVAQVEQVLCQPHRLQHVGDHAGVHFVDDSKATNPHATAAALASMERPVVLMLGGRRKDSGYEMLQPALSEKVRACVLFGEARPFFADLLSVWGVPHAEADGPAEAVHVAFALARRGDVVLLSPACASFDMFRSYAHRGRVFSEMFRRYCDA